MKRGKLFDKNRNMSIPEVNVQELLDQVRSLTQNQAMLVQTINTMRDRSNDPFLNFSIPDPIRNIPVFNGNRKEVLAWVEDAEETLNAYDSYKNDPIYSQIERAVKNKITGEAKEVLIAAGNPKHWNEIKDVLLNAYGDRRDITSHIQSLFYIRQGKNNLSDYYNKIRQIDTAIKSSAASMEDYKSHAKVINSFVSLITLTRFVDGLSEEISMHVRSCRPDSLEHAYEITMQYSNAAYRHRMDRRTQLASQTKHSGQPTYSKPGPSNHPNPNRPPSGKFINKNNIDEDVSMRSHRSNRAINNHSQNKEVNLDEEEEDDAKNKTHDDELDSEDDDYFKGDEINFHMATGNKQRK